MFQQDTLDEALELLSDLTSEVKKYKDQKQNDAEFSVQKQTIIKVRTLVASLDQLFSPQKSLASMNGK